MVDLLHLASSKDNITSYFEIITQIKSAFCSTSKKLSALADQLHDELCIEFSKATRQLTDVDIIKFLFFRYCQNEGVQMFLSDPQEDLVPINMNNWVDLDPDDIVFLIKELEYEVDIYSNEFAQVMIFMMSSSEDVDSTAMISTIPVPSMELERRKMAIKAIIAEFSGKFERRIIWRGRNRSPCHRSLSTPG